MIKKIIIGIVLFIVLILGAAIAIPFIFKDDIIAKVKATINETLTAKVDFGDFNVSIIRSFPDLSFSMENITVAGTDSFANDTLANIKELYVVLDLMSVIRGKETKIKSFKLTEPNILAKVLPSGKANWDIMKPDTTATTTDTSETKFDIALKKYEIVNGHVIYDDQSLGFYTELKNMNHTGSGDFTQDLFILVTKTTADELTVAYGGVPYLNKVKADLDVPLEMDMKNSVYTFKENKFNLNDLILNFSGSIAMPDTNINMDLKFGAEKSEFKNFLSLIPAIYSSSFKDLTASGKFGFTGHAKGTYNAVSMPGFGINLFIENGSFKYPDLPTGVNNVQLDLKINNPDGDLDKTVVDMSRLHIEFGTEPFDAKLLLKTPISDPDMDAMLKGKIDLANMTKIVPIEDTKLSGVINADVSAKGKLSTVEKGNYEAFDAKGTVNISNLNYSSKDTPKPLSISNASMSFSPKNITLSQLNAKLGKSDFAANGTLDNYLAYALRDQSLQGKLNLTSNVIDVNELMGPETPEAETPATEEPMTVFEVPKNIDFVMTSKINKIYYDNMEIDNLVGNIIIKEQVLSFEKVSLNTLDGKMTLDGNYNTKDIKKPTLDMQFGIANMNIQKAFKTFNTVQKLAPIAERTNGTFSMNLAFRSDLGTDMKPVLPSVQGEGSLNIPSATVEGSKAMLKLADATKIDQFKKLSLTNVALKFKILNGRVTVDPFDVKQGPIAMNIAGSSGLDQTLDYKIKFNLPKGSLGSAANNVIGGLVGQLNKQGANYNPGDVINVSALIGGTMSDPSVKLSMADAGKGVKDALKNVIDTKKTEAINKGKEEARKKADQILAAAQKQADAIRNESKKLAEKTKSEGYAAADKLEKEAKNPIAKAAAKEGAKKLRKEADEKSNKIIAEGDKKANDVMAKARAEADALLN
jgi:hypothetical protein